MKKIIALMMVLVLAFALAACSNTTQPAATPAPTEVVEETTTEETTTEETTTEETPAEETTTEETTTEDTTTEPAA